MKKASVAETVTAIIAPVAEAQQVSLWDVEYVKEGASMHLRITIDKPDGVTIDDCEAFHRAIDPILDKEDPIEDSYYLEVSSPGIEREIRTDNHIAACIGESVCLHLYKPFNNAKSVIGTLQGTNENGQVCLQLGESVYSFDRSNISKMNVVYPFDEN